MERKPLNKRLKDVLTPNEEYDKMFGISKAGIIHIKLCDLKPYPNQPFKLYTPDKLQELSEDIKENGVLSPIIVRKMPADDTTPFDYYQILAGHNRVNASELAGLDEIPAIVKDVDDNTANLIVVNTNLNQRDKLLPSEKAFAYKMQMQAMKQQGKRTDLTSGTVCQKSSGSEIATSGTVCQKIDTGELIASKSEDSARNIRNYIRLTYLITPLLDMVDNELIPFRAGVEISYLSADEQNLLLAYISDNKIKVMLNHAEDMRRYVKDMGELTINVLDRIFKPEMLPREKKSIILQFKKIDKYIPPSIPKENMEEYIIKALEAYQNNGGQLNAD